MITKYGRGGVQGAMGLKIAKYDIAGLQIVIGLGLQSATKILKKWIKKCDGITNHAGLQTDTVQYFYLSKICHGN